MAAITPFVEITETPERFTITARGFGRHTVYTATLPVCWCERIPCLAAYDHGKTIKLAAPGCDGGEHEHCHGMRAYHRAHVERFAADVAKTFRPWKPRPRTLPGFESWMRNCGRKILADCPAWPVVDDLPKALPAPCDCDSCRNTLALIGRAA